MGGVPVFGEATSEGKAETDLGIEIVPDGLSIRRFDHDVFGGRNGKRQMLIQGNGEVAAYVKQEGIADRHIRGPQQTGLGKDARSHTLPREKAFLPAKGEAVGVERAFAIFAVVIGEVCEGAPSMREIDGGFGEPAAEVDAFTAALIRPKIGVADCNGAVRPWAAPWPGSWWPGGWLLRIRAQRLSAAVIEHHHLLRKY